MLAVNLVLFLIIVCVSGLRECEKCPPDNGVCINIKKCKIMKDNLKVINIEDKLCGFDGTEPLVCCDNTPNKNTPTFSENYVSEVFLSKNGEMAKAMCDEYHRQVNDGCMRGSSPYNEYSRVKCRLTIDDPSISSTDAAPGEYPHMALVGMGPKISVEWVCGGTIVSNRYVLTAGHCTAFYEIGESMFVLVGTSRISDGNDEIIYSVSRIFTPPGYRSGNQKYKDIALLQTHKEIQLNEFTIPACLHTGDFIKDDVAVASGWKVEKDGNLMDMMQKKSVKKYSYPACNNVVKENKFLAGGINFTTQMCYGGGAVDPDNCNGHMYSGSPLQVKGDNYCMWTVTGFVIFGQKCGDLDVCMQVAPFVPWIESVVWG